MEKKIFDYIEKHNMISRGDLIVTGLSGGADSMCLIKVLQSYQKKVDFRLCAVHVNHMIRGEEAFRDENYVKEYCESNGIMLKVFHIDVPEMSEKLHMSCEEAGRKARYDSFNAVCDELGDGGTSRIAVAHHANDQAETVLFQLIRGSGVRGGAGIRPVNDRIIRPLLCVTRAQIEEYLKDCGISYVTDSTNLSNDYSRNKLRNEIIPYFEKNLNEGAVENIASFAEILNDTYDYIGENADKVIDEYVRIIDDIVFIDKAVLHEAAVIRRIIIHRMLGVAAGSKKDICSIHVSMAEEVLASPMGTSVSLPYTLTVQAAEKGIYIYKGNKDIYEHKEIRRIEGCDFPLIGDGNIHMEIEEWDKNKKFTADDYTKYFDYDKIKVTLSVRSRKTGDYIIVTQDGKRKNIKQYFIDRKVPRTLRDRVMLVAADNDILWIAGLRDSAGYRIDENTTHVLKMWVEGKEK